ncbi:DUF4352 domain-containing protein [Actinomycetes bacterium KLBMP 9797]
MRARLAIIAFAAVAGLLSCCAAATGAVTGALLWGDDVYHRLLRARADSVRVGEAGRDGRLEFLVTGVTCAVRRVGDPFVSQAAVGQFCLVDLVVRNVGGRPATFADALQRAYGPDGARYAVDSAAGILANPDQQVFLNQLNPGNRVSGVLVYDIPPEGKLAELELHESDDSAGLRVTLS